MSWINPDISANYLKSSYYEGFIDISGGDLNIRNSGKLDVYGQILESGVPIDLHYAPINNPTLTGNITLDGSLNLITSMHNMDFTGNLTVMGEMAATTFTNLSDYRIKEEVQSLSDTIFSIDNLSPKYYLNTAANKYDIGFIAHELQNELPFLVSGIKDGDEMQSINYIGIIGMLVNEVQQLKTICNENLTRITALERM